MISAFYTGERNHPLGMAACELLLARRAHAPSFYDYVARNQSYYVRPLPAAWPRGQLRASDGARMADGVAYAERPTRASRCGGGGPGSTCAWSTTSSVAAKRTRRPATASIRTRNVTLELPSIDEPLIAERRPHAPPGARHTPGPRVQGLEDLRWVVHEDRVWFTAAAYDVPGREGRAQDGARPHGREHGRGRASGAAALRRRPGVGEELGAMVARRRALRHLLVRSDGGSARRAGVGRNGGRRAFTAELARDAAARLDAAGGHPRRRRTLGLPGPRGGGAVERPRLHSPLRGARRGDAPHAAQPPVPPSITAGSSTPPA